MRSGNKPLPEPMLTQFYIAIWCHKLTHLDGLVQDCSTSALAMELLQSCTKPSNFAPQRFGSNSKSVISKHMLWITLTSASCEMALRWILQNNFGDKSILVQVMTWCCQATSHYLNQCWARLMNQCRPRFMSSYDVTRLHWVKSWCAVLWKMWLLQFPIRTCNYYNTWKWTFTGQPCCYCPLTSRPDSLPETLTEQVQVSDAIHNIMTCWSFFSCDLAALWMVFSVRLSVRLSVCHTFWLCFHHCIITKFSGVITNDRSDVHAKGQGQRSKVKVT